MLEMRTLSIQLANITKENSQLQGIYTYAYLIRLRLAMKLALENAAQV